jgi:hypothetical protein
LEGQGPNLSRCPLRPRSPSKSYSGRFAEADIIVDHSVRSDRDPPTVGQIEFAENDLVTPNPTTEILEYLDRQLFTGTAAVTETKRRKASIVAHRLRLTIDHTEYRAETAVGYPDLSSVFDFKSGDIEWAAGKPYPLRFLLVNLGTGRYIATGSNCSGFFQCIGLKLELACGVLI